MGTERVHGAGPGAPGGTDIACCLRTSSSRCQGPPRRDKGTDLLLEAQTGPWARGPAAAVRGRLRVLHGEAGGSSAPLVCPGSEWVLAGDAIPILHSFLHPRELQKPSSYSEHEVPSHHPLGLYWYLHIYNKLASSKEQAEFSKSCLASGAELRAHPSHPPTAPACADKAAPTTGPSPTQILLREEQKLFQH